MMKINVSRLNSLNVLLGPLPSHQDIQTQDLLPSERTVRISVYRTMPFEWIIPNLQSFMRTWSATSDVTLSDYDPTLASFHQAELLEAELHILWIDWRYYRHKMSPNEAVQWLCDRLQALRLKSPRPVLVNNWVLFEQDSDALFSLFTKQRAWTQEFNSLLTQSLQSLQDIGIIDLALLSASLGTQTPFIDHRNDAMSHYPFSGKATRMIARHLGVQLLPAMLAPRIKAIVLDLDETLYSGILGEDGIDGIRLTEAHHLLQHTLLRLKQSGLLLAICSKNELQDVRELFAQREDFPLKWSDFAAIHATWNSKRDSMLEIIQAFNIDPSAMLFVDDSVHELLAMAEVFPEMKWLQADRKAETTLLRLLHYPGLYMLREDTTSSIRTQDIQLNRIREEMKKNATGLQAYLGSLEMQIQLYENKVEHLQRIHELSQKTNQFNLTIKRLSEAEVRSFVEDQGRLTYTVQLSDKLGDSGIIGAILCQYEGNRGNLTEMVFSCRALGREIETVAFYHVMTRLGELGVDLLRISPTLGPRNKPARLWIRRFIEEDTNEVHIQQLLAKLEVDCLHHPAKVIKPTCQSEV